MLSKLLYNISKFWGKLIPVVGCIFHRKHGSDQTNFVHGNLNKTHFRGLVAHSHFGSQNTALIFPKEL